MANKKSYMADPPELRRKFLSVSLLECLPLLNHEIILILHYILPLRELIDLWFSQSITSTSMFMDSLFDIITKQRPHELEKVTFLYSIFPIPEEDFFDHWNKMMRKPLSQESLVAI